MEERKINQVLRRQNSKIKKAQRVQQLSSSDLYNIIHKDAPEQYKHTFILYNFNQNSQLTKWENSINFIHSEKIEEANDLPSFLKLAESISPELWNKRKRMYNIMFWSENENEMTSTLQENQNDQLSIDELEELLRQNKSLEETTKKTMLAALKVYRFIKLDKTKEVYIMQDSFSKFTKIYPFHLRVMPHLNKLAYGYPNEIIAEKLYLGNAKQSQCLEVIQDLQITHIINMTKACECVFENSDKVKVQYLQIKIEDEDEKLINEWFEVTYNYIYYALYSSEKSNARVFVHCEKGMSRSATIIIQFLMKKFQWTFDQALEYVKQRRNIVDPNYGFQEQLRKFEQSNYEFIKTQLRKRNTIVFKNMDQLMEQVQKVQNPAETSQIPQ